MTEADFAAADRVIAVKAAEHRHILESQFPAWRDIVEYWHVHDLDCATPPQTFVHLEQKSRNCSPASPLLWPRNTLHWGFSRVNIPDKFFP